MSKNKNITPTQKVLNAINEVANITGKTPDKVSYTELINSGLVTDFTIKKAGGITTIKNSYFDKDEDLVAKAGGKLVKAYKNKLESKYSMDNYFKEEFMNGIKQAFKDSPLKLHKPLKVEKKKKSNASRTIVAHLSDTHFGANIEKREMGGLNEFNWEVASRRLALFAKQIADYKIQYRKDTDLVIALNGDVIAGVIHNQEWFVDLLTEQFHGSIKLLGQFISYLALHFKSVTVYCSPGNHGRAMHKHAGTRATTHKWDSYENMIYLSLQEAMKIHSNVKFEIPLTPYAVINVQGHKIFMTHGDTVINVGNPGRNLNIKSINEQVNKLNASDIGGTSKFDVVLTGHVHTPTAQLTESGCMLIINGCLSGLDPYAGSIGIFTSSATQQLFEVVKEHAVGDLRFIQLDAADKDSSLDKIIEPYVRIL